MDSINQYFRSFNKKPKNHNAIENYKIQKNVINIAHASGQLPAMHIKTTLLWSQDLHISPQPVSSSSSSASVSTPISVSVLDSASTSAPTPTSTPTSVSVSTSASASASTLISVYASVLDPAPVLDAESLASINNDCSSVSVTEDCNLGNSSLVQAFQDDSAPMHSSVILSYIDSGASGFAFMSKDITTRLQLRLISTPLADIGGFTGFLD